MIDQNSVYKIFHPKKTLRNECKTRTEPLLSSLRGWAWASLPLGPSSPLEVSGSEKEARPVCDSSSVFSPKP